jgi:hypothetical protein
MTKEEIDQMYLDQANQLEAEFFDIVDEGLPSQHRQLKPGKTIEDFNQQQAVIWQNHHAALVAEGYADPIPERQPPLSTHWAIVDSINLGAVKPGTVRRTWQGEEYTADCYVTENIRDQYLAGNIAVGDYVLVEFLDESLDMAVVVAKVVKTW